MVLCQLERCKGKCHLDFSCDIADGYLLRHRISAARIHSLLPGCQEGSDGRISDHRAKSVPDSSCRPPRKDRSHLLPSQYSTRLQSTPRDPDLTSCIWLHVGSISTSLVYVYFTPKHFLSNVYLANLMARCTCTVQRLTYHLRSGRHNLSFPDTDLHPRFPRAAPSVAPLHCR